MNMLKSWLNMNIISEVWVSKQIFLYYLKSIVLVLDIHLNSNTFNNNVIGNPNSFVYNSGIIRIEKPNELASGQLNMNTVSHS